MPKALKLSAIKIDKTDLDGVLDFWEHFGIKVPAYLKKASDDFIANPSVETQEEFRFALCAAIREEDDIFSDDLFCAIRESSEEVYKNALFEKHLLNTLVDKTTEIVDQPAKTEV